MRSFATIEYFDIPKDSRSRLGAGLEMLVIQPLLFEFSPEALHWRIIPAVRFTAHGTDETIFF